MDILPIFKKILFILLAPLYAIVAALGHTFSWWESLWSD
tara:strand:+ start:4094 stop:4210 length:117 start_codon:yes stop_codon:yes gene_type:complete